MYLRKKATQNQSEKSPYSRFLKTQINKIIYEVNNMLIEKGHEHLPLYKYTIPWNSFVSESVVSCKKTQV